MEVAEPVFLFRAETGFPDWTRTVFLSPLRTDGQIQLMCFKESSPLLSWVGLFEEHARHDNSSAVASGLFVQGIRSKVMSRFDGMLT
jgi:hypothetical protein